MNFVSWKHITATALLLSHLQSPLHSEQWKRNEFATQRYEINGTGGRNNPLRRPLETPISDDEVFVRFRIRYDARSIDSPGKDEGEFFVLWLDQVEGNDSSTHGSATPNLGIHVFENENRFMARFSPSSQKFSAKKLEGDREYLIVGRLWKSSGGASKPFDQLELWVDPIPEAENSPDASASSTKSISEVRWLGFSTGAKTEVEDSIIVWDVDMAKTWERILKLPQKPDHYKVPQPETRQTIQFTKHVYPILKTRCFKCHAGNDAKEGVRLDVLDEVLNQTAPRNASASRLIKLVADGEMPPEGEPLGAEEIATLSTWIDEGLDWDEKLLPTPIPVTKHWSFQPLRRPTIPSVRNNDWIRTPVDAFIARKHEELGLSPAAPADVQTLARRLSLDILGLPPTNRANTDIDSLLSNPAYGERWGRHWLDVARWAESNGHQHNRHRAFAWRYRDWVVDAFNSDKPYDNFIREQIAGDEILPYQDENIVATGFLAAARYSGNELDKDIQRNDILVDITNTTAQAFLGLTFECAQCHTHKFDPISIRDYYRFQAFFSKGQPGNVVFARAEETARKLINSRWGIFDTVHARLVAVKRRQGHPEPIYVIPKAVVAGMKLEERVRFLDAEKKIAALPQSWSFYSPANAGHDLPVAPHDMRWPLPRHSDALEHMQTSLLVRGDVKARGPEVEPGWPTVFGTTLENFQKPRSALAEWMAHPDNPLTARVWVNRIWQWHFGRGLVETSGDFGTQGATPTHPDLLDFLAFELIENGWSTNHIHRLILNSATYRQSSQYSAANAAIDPDNKMLWRWTPRRLEAEAIRDSILAASGQLRSVCGGPSRKADSNCRSIYILQRRDNLPHQQMLFDSANAVTSCSRRRVSTTAIQPLWLLNSQFAQQAAERLAARAGSIRRAMKLTIGREATDEEVAALQDLSNEYGLKSACLAILNSSEFLYIP